MRPKGTTNICTSLPHCSSTVLLVSIFVLWCGQNDHIAFDEDDAAGEQLARVGLHWTAVVSETWSWNLS